jgi:hypothetical protein
MMQKVKARVNRTKAVVGAKAKQIGGLVKQEGRAISAGVSARKEDIKDDNTLNYVERQGRISARKAQRVKRRYERNVSSPNEPVFKGENLPTRKRKAIRVINEGLKTKLEGRERKKLAKEYYADLKSKPKTMEEMRKQNAKKQRRAVIGNTSIGAGTSSGVSGAAMQNVCPVTAMNGGKKGTKCKPKKK